MPLLDHFHPPLSVRRHWHGFHNAWATYIASELNERLPPGYFAEPNVQFGIEIDVAAFDEAPSVSEGSKSSSVNSGNGATLSTWTPPAPTQTVPMTLTTDTAEVLVYANDAGPTLAGAIELVSPANKDRPAHRNAFVSKCAALLQQGVGLAVIDIVTERTSNLHYDLLARVAAADLSPAEDSLYAAAYRPVDRDGQQSLDIWSESLAVGRPLPTLPFWLRGNVCLPLDLESSYSRTCREQRMPMESES